MDKTTKTWDYLIVTAANDQQAKAYDIQIRQRQEAGGIPQARRILIVPDLDGKRIGSGGSTLQCLLSILRYERTDAGPGSFDEAEAILRNLRILIIHAGGDSRRLPAYSHCGKMFVPIPASGQSTLAGTLFDRLVPAFLALPEQHPGQIVVASGDALILFDASAVKFNGPGITALGSFASPREAAHHGVFCSNSDGSVRKFLQKPSSDAQIAAGAVNNNGDAVLDLGVMSIDSSAAVRLMHTFFEPGSDANGKPTLLWKPEVREALFSHGIDLYREICCALGTDTTIDDYRTSVRSAGSTLDTTLLTEWFARLRNVPFNLNVLPRCQFLHFGTTRQLITSGFDLLAEDSNEPAPPCLILNSDVQGEIAGGPAWIEGCLIGKALTLEGLNTLVGVDVVEPLSLRRGACLDMSAGVSREGKKVWFLRYYGIDDTFKHSAERGGTFCGRPIERWLNTMRVLASDIWSADIPVPERTLWNARVFPALAQHQEFREWLWLLDPESVTSERKNRFLNADRYSCSEIAILVDQVEFHGRRSRICSAVVLHENR